MPLSEKKIKSLFEKYLDNNITEIEHQQFWSLVNANDNKLSDDLKALWLDGKKQQIYLTTFQWDRKMRQLMQRPGYSGKQKKIGRVPRKTVKLAAIAFCLLACTVIAGHFAHAGTITRPQSHFKSVNSIHKAGYTWHAFNALS